MNNQNNFDNNNNTNNNIEIQSPNYNSISNNNQNNFVNCNNNEFNNNLNMPSQMSNSMVNSSFNNQNLNQNENYNNQTFNLANNTSNINDQTELQMKQNIQDYKEKNLNMEDSLIKKSNNIKVIILALITIVIIATIISILKGKNENNMNSSNEQDLNSTGTNLSPNNTMNGSDSNDYISLNTYANIGEKVEMKVIGTEPEPEDSIGHSMYYYIHMVVKNNNDKNVVIYTPSMDSNHIAFARFDALFIDKNSDIQNLTESDLLLQPCRLKEITRTNGTTIKITTSTNEDIAIVAGEETNILLSCAITRTEEYAKGVLPVLLRVFDTNNSIIENFSLK